MCNHTQCKVFEISLDHFHLVKAHLSRTDRPSQGNTRQLPFAPRPGLNNHQPPPVVQGSHKKFKCLDVLFILQVHLASVLPLRLSSLLLPLLPLPHPPQANQDVREPAGFLQHRPTSARARPSRSVQRSGQGVEKGEGWSNRFFC